MGLLNFTQTQLDSIITAINNRAKKTEAVLLTSVGAASGVAGLGTDGKVPNAQLPATALSSGSQMVRGTAVTASGTAVDFTSIPSWVKRITVMFQGLSSSGVSNWQLQLGSGSIQTTGYLGAFGYQTVSYNLTTGFGQFNDTAADLRHGAITFINISGNVWACSGITAYSTRPYLNTTAGSVTLSGVLDRLRLTTVNGTDTFDAGTLNIIYEG